MSSPLLGCRIPGLERPTGSEWPIRAVVMMLHEGSEHDQGGGSSSSRAHCSPLRDLPTADAWHTLALWSISGRLLWHLKLSLPYPARLRSTASGAQPRCSCNKRSTDRGGFVPVRPSLILCSSLILCYSAWLWSLGSDGDLAIKTTGQDRSAADAMGFLHVFLYVRWSAG